MSAENEFELDPMQYQNESYAEETIYVQSRTPNTQYRSQNQFYQPSTSSNYQRKENQYESCEIKSTVLKPSQAYYQLATSHNSTRNNPLLAGPLNPQPKKSKRGTGKRKNCNCTKSQCLKLYCDCFANGEFCLDCNCKDCHNNLEHESERSRAIKSSLDRNPHAFKPKIGVAAKVGKAADLERLHQKGCNCKKSNCLKNYCECYEAKVPCTERCKCVTCKNTEHDRAVRFREKFSAAGLAQLAAAAANDNRGETPSEDSDSDNERADPKGQPWFYMTDDVIEATTMCLVSYGQEMEQSAHHRSTEEEIKEEMEKGILLEFSRCLSQIVDSAKSGNRSLNI
ncbi:unnamed protein product [Bursaphelenchus okinawaensis]|uniref:CRC domain-containing protein n=1 Tax=Bursaphelenchus okinawaensis TaxID=465554 RepID=A0A811L510_9BILA|nr:unnamed protein product [Bursaphelenchus okinawaensis]CAG9119771.1 unnamed protein product [Bursaphelenchus okinawaensis]